MNRLSPPRVPMWLLERFGVTARNEPLAGDLIEEFRSGRSRAWFWTQAFLSILLMARADLWEHKLLAARALLVGEIATIALSFLFGNTVYRWGPRFGILSVSWWLFMLGALFVIYALSGWVVGRLHRQHRGSMVLWFAALSCCFCVVWSFPLLSIHVVNSIDSPRFRPYLAFDLVSLIIIFTAVLVGGLSKVSRKSQGLL